MSYCCRKQLQRDVPVHEYLNGTKFGQRALVKSHENIARVGLLLTVHTVKCLELLVRCYDGKEHIQTLE